MKQLTKEAAIKFYESGVWKDMSDDDIVKMQLWQKRLCVPLSVFHECITNVLNRPVYTHEFAHMNLLQEEYMGTRDTPTFEDIMNLIPKDKLTVINIEREGE